jgi:uncharacterized membrane protein
MAKLSRKMTPLYRSSLCHDSHHVHILTPRPLAAATRPVHPLRHLGLHLGGRQAGADLCATVRLRGRAMRGRGAGLVHRTQADGQAAQAGRTRRHARHRTGAGHRLHGVIDLGAGGRRAGQNRGADLFTMPIWTLLLAWPLLGERIKGTQWLAAICTLGGLLLIIEPWNMHTSLFSKFLGVLAALCWAIGTVLVKRLRAKQKVDLLSLTTWQMLIGAVPLVLLATVVPEHATDWSLTYIGILIFMAVISTALCWWLWISLLDRVPAWEASLSVLGTPVVALISGRMMLGEDFRVSEITGIVLIGTGLALLSLIGWLASKRSGLARTTRPEQP